MVSKVKFVSKVYREDLHRETLCSHNEGESRRFASLMRSVKEPHIHISGWRPSYEILKRLILDFYYVVWSFAPSVYARLHRKLRSYVEVLKLPKGRAPFWTEHLGKQINYLRRECSFSAEEVCRQLFGMGIRVTKKALLRFIMRTKGKLPPLKFCW